jgi:hypothetical protein
VPGDVPATAVLGEQSANLLLAATLTFRDFVTRGLDLSVGVRNLLDERIRAFQPFAGGHAPLPLAGREVGVRIGFDRDLAAR